MQARQIRRRNGKSRENKNIILEEKNNVGGESTGVKYVDGNVISGGD